jgi:integrase
MSVLIPAPAARPAHAVRPRLLDQVRQALRVRRYSQRTEEAFVGVVRARKPERVPVVLSRGEVRRLLGAVEGDARLVCLLL